MEGTYCSENYRYGSQLFKIREYFVEYTKFLAETVYSKEAELESKESELEKISCLMEINLDECKELDQLCSLSLLDSQPEENPPQEGTENLEDALLEKATRTLVTAVELKAAKSRPLKRLNMIKELKKALVPRFEAEPNPSPLLKIPNNFVLIARIYNPFNSFSGSKMTIPHSQDIMLLGSQNLVFFREKITCQNDGIIVGDANNFGTPEGSQVPMKRLISSGMFFIGDTFYCDFRDMMSKNYGEVIDQWAQKNPQMKLGPFKHQPMEQTIIADLEFRLGYPYVFMHLGSCEHLITFVDARLMSPEDLQDQSRYPLNVEADFNPSFCSVCETYATSWIVEDDAFPTKPANLCKRCFEVFYTRNGKLAPPPFCCKVPDKDGSQGAEPTDD